VKKSGASNTLTAGHARANLYRLVDETAASHRPVLITGRRADAVLVSDEDWMAIQETLSMLCIPGMRKSIRSGMDAPIQYCSTELRW
jgi:prevent-host-death family protein